MPSDSIHPPSSSESEQTASRSIVNARARQVIDSRGNPTVEAEVVTGGGIIGRGTVPSGASTGANEAIELRDGDPKVYAGKGVTKAVSNVNDVIRPRILGLDSVDQVALDRLMIMLDGTPNKSKLGANAILAVSMASARAGALSEGLSLFRYLGGSLSPSSGTEKRHTLPIPMMNVINGGKHAGNKLSFQEFLIEPLGGKSYSDAFRCGVEVYQSLRGILKDSYGPQAINVGDEGGYAPPLSTTREALDSILSAISNAGYDERTVRLGLDAASSSFFNEFRGTYLVDGREFRAGELHDYYDDLVKTYHILTLEDPFSEEDFDDFAKINGRLGSRVKIIGDDLYVTNIERIGRGIKSKATNAVLIKLNQIGSVTETIEATKMSSGAGLMVVVSHRSGETEDNFISHLAVAVGSQFIKTGAPARGERTAKYNELLRIEEELGPGALFAGSEFS